MSLRIVNVNLAKNAVSNKITYLKEMVAKRYLYQTTDIKSYVVMFHKVSVQFLLHKSSYLSFWSSIVSICPSVGRMLVRGLVLLEKQKKQIFKI